MTIKIDSKMRGRLTRRSFLGTTAWAALGLSPAFAQDPIHQVLQNRAAEWSDGFDAAGVGRADVRTSTPTMSPQIVDAVQQAIGRYSDIAARGGWPFVPAERKLSIGMRDPAVAALRQRLTVSGDLPTGGGDPDAFDSYVDAAVRRFQACHGIQVDGVVGESTWLP